MSFHLYKGDIPESLQFTDIVAVDTEAMGLNYYRDRLCLIQLSSGDGSAHFVQLGGNNDYAAPRLKAVLENENITKLFHFARFDLAIITRYLDVVCKNIYCTKVASKIARTYTDKHGLKELCKELLNVEISKQQQSTDWGANELSKSQMNYAANDVLYLHRIKDKLDEILIREERLELAKKVFEFLPSRVELDLRGWLYTDIFSH